MAAWPGTLPQRVEIADFEAVQIDNVVRSPMAVGAKSRLRDTYEVRQFTVALRLTAAQVATLRTFYVTTLVHGSGTFTWTEFDDPNTQATYRFMAPYRLRAISPSRFRAVLSLATA